jgi:uncharacterized Zn finger protein
MMDTNTSSHGCPQCGSNVAQELGMLGTLLHLRCRNCGWTYSITCEQPDDDDYQLD